MNAPPEIVTDASRLTESELRRFVEWSHEIVAENALKQSEILRLRLALSCILPIAEKHAAMGSPDRRTCELIRASLGEPPASGKPLIVVDNTRSGS